LRFREHRRNFHSSDISDERCVLIRAG
jgi:hypothetical protein